MMKLLLCLLINFISMSNTVLATTTTRDVFKDGPYMVATVNVPTKDTSNPPKPLIVSYPCVEEKAEFGVVMLLHGYLLSNTFYSQLIHHLTSYGFIVVAPQLYSYESALISDSTKDIETAANITNWLASGNLSEVLPNNLIANLTHFALAGHSRGGKDAFGLALGTVNVSSSLPLSALIGIDPVDGNFLGQTPPPILSNDQNASFTALKDLPVMVIGSGLDDEKGGLIRCTPNGLSHKEFYRECEKPACYFLVKGYGHLDVLDDNIGWIWYYVCKSGASREPMRRFVGGASVAFLKAYLDKDDAYLMAIKEKNVTIPVDINLDFRL